MSESDVKYCPECNAEYYAHIIDCADCGVPLKTPEELSEIRERQRRFEEEDAQEAVAIRQDRKSWILELHQVLIAKGYSSRVTVSPGCTPGACSETFLLIVPKEEAESAAKCIDEYAKEIHPELRKSKELASQGKCPACGYNVGFDAKECSDCGLLLVIEGE